MVSFADFMINFLEKIGVFYVFSLILVSTLVYITSYLILSSIKVNDNQLFKGKVASVISALLAISAAFLTGYIYEVTILIRYFTSLSTITLLIIFFIILLFSFMRGTHETLPDKWKRNVVVVLLILLVIFAFVSLYYSFKDYFEMLNLGQGAKGGEYIIFRTTWRPEILIVPFIFIFMGIVAVILGRDEESK